jgi:hypothetical protein
VRAAIDKNKRPEFIMQKNIQENVVQRENKATFEVFRP